MKDKTIVFSLLSFARLPAFLASIFLASPAARAGSATWQLDPPANIWNSASDWMPNTVPNGPNDVATFAISNQTDVSITAPINISQLVFASGASAFTITAEPISQAGGENLLLSGEGIMNNSGLTQNFVVSTIPGSSLTGRIAFANSATAGEETFFAVQGSRQELGYGARMDFSGTSRAGSAHFVIDAGTQQNSPGGTVNFSDQASADHATFTIAGATGSGFSYGAGVYFSDQASAGNATFICEASDNPDGYRGGGVIFQNESTAGDSTIILNGGVSRSSTLAFFDGTASAGSASLTANPAPRGSGTVGAAIELWFSSTAETAKIILKGYPEHGPEDGLLDLTTRSGAATIGSLAGDGTVQLGVHKLIVGGLDENSTFSGQIADEDGQGSLAKIGSGRLLLRGVSTFGGGTTVNQGELNVATQAGSATGSGLVLVNSGLLSGKGTIGGAVTISAEGVLGPSLGSKHPTTLTIQSLLTFRAGALFAVSINANNRTADQVSANGIAIASGAEFGLSVAGRKRLQLGSVFTVLDNTSAGPIAGTFANLAEGATVTAGKNSYRASYQGGDGNDLTLTAVANP